MIVVGERLVGSERLLQLRDRETGVGGDESPRRIDRFEHEFAAAAASHAKAQHTEQIVDSVLSSSGSCPVTLRSLIAKVDKPLRNEVIYASDPSARPHQQAGGQDFIASTLPKLERLRAMLTTRGATCDVEVDGGIHTETAPQAVRAGANVLVAGTSVFGTNESVPEAMSRLRTGRN